MKTKKCNNCEETKPVDQFSKDKSKEDGLRTQCKACIALKRKGAKKKAAPPPPAKAEASTPDQAVIDEGVVAEEPAAPPSELEKAVTEVLEKLLRRAPTLKLDGGTPKRVAYQMKVWLLRELGDEVKKRKIRERRKKR